MRHRLLTAFALTVSALATVGCNSADRMVVSSTHATPRTVSIVDTTTNVALWTIAVPPGQTLVLNADNDNDLAGIRQSDSPATELKWAIYDSAVVGTNATDRNEYTFKPSLESGELDLPGNPIRIDVSISDLAAIEAAAPPAAEAKPVEQQMEDAADAAEPIPAEAPAETK